MYSPPGQGSDKEWVELYNFGDKEIEIFGGVSKNSWVFVDSSGAHFLAKEPLRGSLIIKPKEFLILANNAEEFLKSHPNFSGNLADTTMSLPDSYGFIQIKNEQGVAVSQALWSQNLGANANNRTLEFTKNIFRESLRDYGSPGEENSVENVVLPPAPSPVISSLPKPLASPTPQPKPKTGKVVLNEISYNPGQGSQAWVELKNQETKEIDLSGWKIVQLQKKGETFIQGTVKPNGFFMVNLPGLNKNSETVQIFDSENKKIFEVRYSSPIPLDWSAARFEDSIWKITSRPTPEKENIYFVPQEIKQNFVPQELIPMISFENSSKVLTNQNPPDKNLLILKGLALSFLLSLCFVALKKKLTL
ncbi:MAG: hypothetical protein UW89_C0013G0009 [Parcubacteria group bacterium GW2011_GWB1_45_10]|nr:MAG: hypothetical protein UW89_C0013G0009 [Parcubacteria group bacterium GW2011_GWB1_45_10]